MEKICEIVLSGMSGRFPYCDLIDDLADKLYGNVDCVSTALAVG